MARLARSAKLDTRSARFDNLKQQRAPYWHAIAPGFALGYRKGRKGGVWLAKLVIPGILRRETTLGSADDFLDSDGEHVLNFAQAQRKAFDWKAQVEATGGKRLEAKSIGDAIDGYAADLKVRGADVGNVTRLRAHLTNDLLAKPVAAVTYTDMRSFRDTLTRAPQHGRHKARPHARTTQKLSPATINRTCTVLKAALNQVADDPEQGIANRQAWQGGLEAIPDAETPRNIILRDESRLDNEWWRVRHIIDEAHNHSPEFGLLVEVAAETGARYSQLRRLEVADLQARGREPRLMMPSSKKGKKGVKKALRRPVPISDDLATKLQAFAFGKASSAPLLTKPVGSNWGGGPWNKTDHQRPFDEIVERCALGDWERLGYPAKVTMYALRHSSIVRQILDGVPIRVVAVNHDTSVGEIEKNYSERIGDHTDEITRSALRHLSKRDAVVPLPSRA